MRRRTVLASRAAAGSRRCVGKRTSHEYRTTALYILHRIAIYAPDLDAPYTEKVVARLADPNSEVHLHVPYEIEVAHAVSAGAIISRAALPKLLGRLGNQSVCRFARASHRSLPAPSITAPRLTTLRVPAPSRRQRLLRVRQRRGSGSCSRTNGRTRRKKT